MIKGIIFDMDGVLVDAEDWHYDALNKALRLFGHEITRYNHLTTYNGLSTKKKLEMLSIEANLPKELHDFINEMKQIYTVETIHTKCKPKFTHQYALSTLKSMGYKLAVASNSIRSTVELIMQKTHLSHLLDFTLSASDVKNPKPDPEIYLAVISRLGLTPSECLIVEDNENGIKAALASGAHLLQVHNVNEVNFENIYNKIFTIEKTHHAKLETVQ